MEDHSSDLIVERQPIIDLHPKHVIFAPATMVESAIKAACFNPFIDSRPRRKTPTCLPIPTPFPRGGCIMRIWMPKWGRVCTCLAWIFKPRFKHHRFFRDPPPIFLGQNSRRFRCYGPGRKVCPMLCDGPRSDTGREVGRTRDACRGLETGRGTRATRTINAPMRGRSYTTPQPNFCMPSKEGVTEKSLGERRRNCGFSMTKPNSMAPNVASWPGFTTRRSPGGVPLFHKSAMVLR